MIHIKTKENNSMKVTRDFILNGNRYPFDFKLCTTDKGFAQIDTEQDASYFGMWANPFTLQIITYCEGDVTIQEAENEKEFIEEIRNIKKWNIENGFKFYGIDPGFNEKLKEKFENMDLGDLLH